MRGQHWIVLSLGDIYFYLPRVLIAAKTVMLNENPGTGNGYLNSITISHKLSYYQCYL